MRIASFVYAGLAAAVLSTSAGAAPVLMISIDGLRPRDILTTDNPLVNAPNLRALAAGGAWADGVVNVLPTVTYPNHTTLITGVAPALHGITNNTTFDPLQKSHGAWYWYSAAIKVPTLWDAVHAKGGTVASVSWPVSVGAPGVDYNLPEIWRDFTAGDLKLIESVATPGLVAELEKSTGVPLAKSFSENPDGDEARAKYAAALIAAHHPAFTTLHIVSLDHFQHKYGPGTMEAADTLARIDTMVGTLVAEARKAEPDLVVAIVSDHGFTPVSEDSNLIVAFAKAGFIKLDESGKVVSWDAMPWGAGGSAAVVLAHPEDKAMVKKVGDFLAKLIADPRSGLARMIDARGIAAAGGGKEPSFWLDFKLGMEMGSNTTGALITPSKNAGMHGYFPFHPEMRATFIVNGPALAKKGSLGEIDMRDIAPTLAKIMDAKLPSATGKPLF